MKDSKILEQLSAYLDGETELPESLAQRLKDDPALAERVQQWQRLSSALQELPKPEPHPAFPSRVLAHADEIQQKHRHPALVFGTPLALAATVLCIFSVYLLQRPTLENTDYTRAVNQAKIYQDDDAVVAALASLLDQGADLSYFSEVEEDTDNEWSAVTVDEWVNALAENATGTDATGTWNLDVYGSWESLSEEEASYLINSTS